ncbi:PLD nuclease N-terminal domain-containing protein [Oleiharenicola sp. Vm1]|uniref:PLD nuclease N-terminal domain-containing protein n=1 Tax=Oleiharenicola sp. Vm1 TaxID=3398393 RepID=UPI0039F4F0D0
MSAQEAVGGAALLVIVMWGFALITTMAMFGVWLFSFIHCLRNRHDKDRLLWVLVTFFGGPIGAVIYWAFGRRGSEHATQRSGGWGVQVPPSVSDARAPTRQSDRAFFDHHGLVDPKERSRQISDAVWREGRSHRRGEQR